nr:MAG TPA: hypothetical protein [Caudoviricetes sp.]
MLNQVEVGHATSADRIVVRGNVGQTSRVQNLDTSLNRLILHELPTLEGMDSRQSIVLHVPDLVGDIHLIIVDTIDDTLGVSRAQNDDQVGVTTQLIGADELIDTLVGSDNSLNEVQIDRTDVAGSGVSVLGRSNLADQLRSTEDRDSHVGVIQHLHQTGDNAIQVIHEGLMTPLDMIQSVISARSKVEGGGELALIRHRDEGLIELVVNLIILVVAQSQADQAQDLGQLIDLIQSANVLNLLRRHGDIDGIGGRNLNDIRTDRPRDRASGQHSRAGVETSIQTNLIDNAMHRSQSELVLLHVTRDDVLVQLGRSSRIGSTLVTALDLDTLHDGTIILTISRSEVQMGGNPAGDLTIGIDRLAGLGVDIASAQINRHMDSRDVGLDAQVLIAGTTDSGDNVGSLSLGQSHLNFLEGSRRIDGILHLVLFLPHIDLVTLSIDQGTGLHGDSELGFLSNDLGNSTLVEDVVHKNILMNGESHTNDRVVAGQVSVFQDSVGIVIKLCLSHLLSIVNQGSILTQSIDLGSDHVGLTFNEEVLQGLLGSTQHHSLLRLREEINTGLGQNITNALLESSSKLLNRIISIALAHAGSRLAITNNRHFYFLLSKKNIFANIPFIRDIFNILLIFTF